MKSFKQEIWQNIKATKFKAEYTFALPNCNPVYKEFTANNLKDVGERVLAEKIEWFKFCLDHFIKTNQKNCTKTDVLEKIKQYHDLVYQNNKPIYTVCNAFIRGFHLFCELLPPIGSDQHKTEQDNLNELKYFCESQIA